LKNLIRSFIGLKNIAMMNNKVDTINPMIKAKTPPPKLGPK
jgi:hypothetical protein